jgi:hypothetical protein
VLQVEGRCAVKAARLLVCLAVLLAGCPTDQPPLPPVQVDAPELASSLRWVGVCAVICSALGAAALVIATHNRRK